MRVRRRRVTIEVNHYKFRVEQNVPKTPEDRSENNAVSDLAYSPPERRPPAEDDFRTPILPPKEIV